MRDKRKDNDYFSTIIDRDRKRIEKFKARLENGTVSPNQVPSVMRGIFQIKFGIWLARYSMGDPINDLVPLYREMVFDFLAAFLPDWYTDSLWLLSIGVLLEIDEGTFKSLVNAIKSSGREDWLYDFLIQSRLPGEKCVSDQLLFQKPYLALRHVVEKSEDKRTDMYRYLTNTWYQAHKDAGWYDSHKKGFDINTSIYYGYWSFESGAVAKIIKLDDAGLKDAPYYPYDLVHYKD